MLTAYFLGYSCFYLFSSPSSHDMCLAFCSRQLEANEHVLFEKKKKLRQAIDAGKPIPTELRDEEAELRHQIELEDSKTEVSEDLKGLKDEMVGYKIR